MWRRWDSQVRIILRIASRSGLVRATGTALGLVRRIRLVLTGRLRTRALVVRSRTALISFLPIRSMQWLGLARSGRGLSLCRSDVCHQGGRGFRTISGRITRGVARAWVLIISLHGDSDFVDWGSCYRRVSGTIAPRVFEKPLSGLLTGSGIAPPVLASGAAGVSVHGP
ncbi:hypothetical protein LX36DRAFT_182860 [Colletotrichum falcatum]|nr:hypothetical protein LX36DRAFT_182860 [Colletotrichum falcatum]